jgi:hypothetical protein
VHELALELMDETVQLEELNEPPAPPSLQVTVPDGGVFVEPVSVTLAVNVIEVPAVTDDGFGETVVEVGWGGGGLTASDDAPELAVCVGSPA